MGVRMRELLMIVKVFHFFCFADFARNLSTALLSLLEDHTSAFHVIGPGGGILPQEEGGDLTGPIKSLKVAGEGSEQEEVLDEDDDS
jgi:hypothetical protein